MRILKEDLLKIENYLLSHFAKGNFEVEKNDVFDFISPILAKKLKRNDFYIGLSQAIVDEKFNKLGVDQVDTKLVLFDRAKKTNDDVPKTSTLNFESVKKPHGPFTTINSRRKLWIADSEYSVPLSTFMIESFLLNVMDAKMDINGTIVFDGKRFLGDEKLLHRFLISFVGCGNPQISEPVLSSVDENGVPMCLK